MSYALIAHLRRRNRSLQLLALDPNRRQRHCRLQRLCTAGRSSAAAARTWRRRRRLRRQRIAADHHNARWRWRRRQQRRRRLPCTDRRRHVSRGRRRGDDIRTATAAAAHHQAHGVGGGDRIGELSMQIVMMMMATGGAGCAGQIERLLTGQQQRMRVLFDQIRWLTGRRR